MRLPLLIVVCISVCFSPLACATVPSGQAGVVLRIGSVDTKMLPEGIHWIGPLGVADYHKIVAASLTSSMLEYDRIQELNRLATSSNAKTVVIGPGAGGTPVMLSAPSASSH